MDLRTKPVSFVAMCSDERQRKVLDPLLEEKLGREFQALGFPGGVNSFNAYPEIFFRGLDVELQVRTVVEIVFVYHIQCGGGTLLYPEMVLQQLPRFLADRGLDIPVRFFYYDFVQLQEFAVVHIVEGAEESHRFRVDFDRAGLPVHVHGG